MNIYRIKKGVFEDVTLAGLGLSRLQDYFLGEVKDVSREEEIEDEKYFLLYEDTPLLTLTLLKRIESFGLKNNASVKIGDGYYRNGDFNFATYKSPYLAKFDYGKYAFFLRVVNGRILKKLRSAGVVVMDTYSTFVDAEAVIEAGALLRPRVTIAGKSHVGKNSVVSEGTHIINSYVGEECVIISSHITDSHIGNGVTVGPYACLRKNAAIGDGCRIGDFVEIKNSILGEKVKSAHLTYIGDSVVGDGTNVGCGAVFANYDGKNKHSSFVGKNVFIGANVNLVAPVYVGDGTFIAAGTTVTDDVEENSFVIGRSKQSTRPKR